MSIGYRTNISSLRAIRLNERTQLRLGDSYAQLSSGQRITRPSTDAAGASVAQSLRAETRIAQRARLNVDDGISYLQTADGTFDTNSQLMHRMIELAEQSANGAYSSTQRSSLQREFSQLRAEILRLQDSSRFNDVQVNRGAAVARDPQLFSSTSGVALNASEDGRYITYTQGGALKQKDTVTGNIITIQTSGAGLFASSPQGDQVVYSSGTAIMKYDRLTGSTSTLLSGVSASLLAISGDGSRVAFVSQNVYTQTGATGGADGYEHLATINTATGQVNGDNGTYGFSGYGNLTLTYDGSRIGFVGENGDIEGYLWDSTSLTSPLAATATASDISSQAYVAADGKLYFISSTNLGGTNASGTQSIFSIGPGNSYSKILEIGSYSGFFIGDAGNSITFTSASNIANNGTNGYTQVYKTSLTGSVRRLTNYGSNVAQATIYTSGDGYTLFTASGGRYYTIDTRPEITLTIDTGGGSTGGISVGILSSDAAVRGLYGLDLSTQRGGRVALETLKNGLDQLNLARSAIGSGLNRLSTASRTTESKALNLASAQSQITDVDIAQTLAENARLQILSQLQTSIMAQASSLIPQIALDLLQSS